MKLPRLAPFARVLLLSFGAAGFVLAAVSLALDVVILGQRHVETVTAATSEPGGITRWSDLEPDNPAAFAGHLRALGCPEETIGVLLAGVGKGVPESADASATQPGVVVANASEPDFTSIPSQQMPVMSVSAPAQMSVPAVGTAGGSGASVWASLESASVADVAVGKASSDAASAPARAASQRSAPAMRVSGGIASGALSRTGAASAATGGSAPSTGEATAEAGAADSVIVAPEGSTQIPAAFADAGPGESELTAQERQQIGDIQEQFAQTVAQVESSSPDYRKVWQDAQWLADQQFRALFGNQAFLQRQMANNLRGDGSTAATQ